MMYEHLARMLGGSLHIMAVKALRGSPRFQADVSPPLLRTLRFHCMVWMFLFPRLRTSPHGRGRGWHIMAKYNESRKASALNNVWRRRDQTSASAAKAKLMTVDSDGRQRQSANEKAA